MSHIPNDKKIITKTGRLVILKKMSQRLKLDFLIQNEKQKSYNFIIQKNRICSNFFTIFIYTTDV